MLLSRADSDKKDRRIEKGQTSLMYVQGVIYTYRYYFTFVARSKCNCKDKDKLSSSDTGKILKWKK